MRLIYLVRGLPGHPLHPPITDVVIGTFTFALIASVLDVTGASDEMAAQATGLALSVGFIVSAFAAITGLVDWLRLPRPSPMFRTGLYHLVLMVVAVAIFGVVAQAGESTFNDGDVTAGWFVAILVGFAFLTGGGWLGGKMVFVHGHRVLPAPGGESEEDRPAALP